MLRHQGIFSAYLGALTEYDRVQAKATHFQPQSEDSFNNICQQGTKRHKRQNTLSVPDLSKLLLLQMLFNIQEGAVEAPWKQLFVGNTQCSCKLYSDDIPV